MHDNLYVGMTIYHKTGGTKATICDFEQNNVIIELCKEISSKKILALPITHIGEWLFFEENDILLSANILANKPQYLKYSNKKILEAHKENVEIKKKIDDYEMKKIQEAERQNEIKINRKRKLEEDNKFIKKLKKEFIDMLKSEYQFEGFHHYTDFSNFINIENIGFLLSRNEAKKNGFIDAAEQSVINKTNPVVMNFVRFYYKEKTPTIYDNEGIKVDNCTPHMPIPVLLIFNEDIINYEDVAYTS
ncbi:MAG: DarT ssDNA thymidine ADP-ribosyltransferase family protein, partial [Erysipelotrichaceae bacterium]|nr:DarT ssDNA thymidine ADP-ribosyltransferase family protein [Erysipelotrichaceae bacterium]